MLVCLLHIWITKNNLCFPPCACLDVLSADGSSAKGKCVTQGRGRIRGEISSGLGTEINYAFSLKTWSESLNRLFQTTGFISREVLQHDPGWSSCYLCKE